MMKAIIVIATIITVIQQYTAYFYLNKYCLRLTFKNLLISKGSKKTPVLALPATKGTPIVSKQELGQKVTYVYGTTNWAAFFP